MHGQKHPTREQIKKAFFIFAMENHPDVATSQDPDAARQRFIQGTEEYEKLIERCEARGNSSCRQDAVPETTYYKRDKTPPGEKPQWGTGTYRWTSNEQDESKLSPLQREVKRCVAAGELHAALDTWEVSSGGDLGLLLYLLEECRTREVVPDVKRVLSCLHAQEMVEDHAREGIVQETAVAIFHGRKTQAYNDLIRCCTYGSSKKEELFSVLDEMHVHDVHKDPETFYQIDQCWQNMRQDYSC